jgi:hypothetical protein
MKISSWTKIAVIILGSIAANGQVQHTEHAECANATQGTLGGWSVKNVCNMPIDLGLAWRVQGSNASWSFKLVRSLNPGFQTDTPNCAQCVTDMQLRAFESRDRVTNEELRPYTRN